MLMAYAKGARTFERHIDIQTDGMTVSPYCSVPEQVDTWFKAFQRAKSMCGAPGTQKRLPPQKEIDYLDCARPRSLCQARSAGRPRSAGCRRVSRDPAAAGTDFLPRTDARRSHPQGCAERSAHHDRRHRQPLREHSVAQRTYLQPRTRAATPAAALAPLAPVETNRNLESMIFAKDCAADNSTFCSRRHVAAARARQQKAFDESAYRPSPHRHLWSGPPGPVRVR